MSETAQNRAEGPSCDHPGLKEQEGDRLRFPKARSASWCADAPRQTRSYNRKQPIGAKIMVQKQMMARTPRRRAASIPIASPGMRMKPPMTARIASA